MSTHRISAVFLLLLSATVGTSAAQTALATETWEAASSRLQAHVDARLGQGAIVQIERVDAQTVRVSLKALWPSLLRASFQGGGEPSARYRLCQMEARGAETIIATTTSWSPATGGSTTLNATLLVACDIPLRATLVAGQSQLLLNWTGGVPPFRIQAAPDLALPDWLELATNATPPIAVPTQYPAMFYRVLGR